MTREEVFAFVKAGFTATQIATFSTPPVVAPPVVAPPVTTPPVVAPPVVAPPVVAPPVVTPPLALTPQFTIPVVAPPVVAPVQPGQPLAINNIDTMMAQIQQLSASVHANAINNTQMPPVQTETTEDIMATLIDPVTPTLDKK